MRFSLFAFIFMIFSESSYASMLCWNQKNTELNTAFFPSHICIDELSIFKDPNQWSFIVSVSGSAYSGVYPITKNVAYLAHNIDGGDCSETTLSTLELRFGTVNPDLSFNRDQIQLVAVTKHALDNCHITQWSTVESVYSRN